MKFLLCALISLLTIPTFAGDMGFRYKNGKCVDSKGAAGYNKSFFGQCGDNRGIILQRFDLTGLDLSGSMFDSADLQLSVFDKTNLTGVNFVEANLSGAQFLEATIHGTSFKKAGLANTKFGGANFENVNFTNVDLSKTELSYSIFKNCIFKGTKFGAVNLAGAQILKSDLSNINFSGAQMKDVVLDGSNLNLALFKGAFLAKASLKNVTANRTSFEGANLRDAVISGSNLLSANFRKAHLESVILKDSEVSAGDLTGAIMTGANATKTEFIGALLNGVDLTGANLSGADFQASDLRSAILKDTQYQGTNFKDSRINKQTVLPFSAEEAEAKGMLMPTESVTRSILIWSHYYAESLSKLQKAVTASNSEVQMNVYSEGDPATFIAMMSGMEAVIIPLIQKDDDPVFMKGIATALMEFTTNGGKVLFMGDDSNYVGISGLAKTSFVVSRTSGSTKLFLPDHPMAQGFTVGPEMLQSCLNHAVATDTGVENVIGVSEDESVVYAKTVGAGLLVYIAFDLSAESQDTSMLIRNFINYGDVAILKANREKARARKAPAHFAR